MTYTASYGLGPGKSPKSVQTLMAMSCIVSIFCAFINNFFLTYLEINGPQSLLSLSWEGLSNGYLWQPATYLFVQSSGFAGLSVFFFIELFFNLYILWIMGSLIAEKVGNSSFIYFYFTCGILSGLITILAMSLFNQYTVLAGPTPIILALITVWTMLHPESELLLFFVLPVKAKWILAGICFAVILTNLSNLNFSYMTFYLSGIFFGYLYATLIWELESPYRLTSFFDRFFVAMGKKIRNLSSEFKNHKVASDKESKIFDFHTGKPILDDDRFIDMVLEKISKNGEQSLSWSERNRMQKISEKKSRQSRK